MRLSIIIPAYNEERTIAEVVRNVYHVQLPFDCEREIIIVDDGSTDYTSFVLNNLKKEIPFKLFSHKNNLGKGAAISTALAQVSGNFTLIQDADLEYNPKEIPTLLSAVRDDISAVYSVRGIKKYPNRGLHFVAGAKLLTLLVDVLFHARLSDVYTGYKLFRTDVLRSLNLKSRGFEFEAEVTCKLLKYGFKISEIPITLYNPRNISEGKKIRPRDFFVGVKTIFSCLVL